MPEKSATSNYSLIPPNKQTQQKSSSPASPASPAAGNGIGIESEVSPGPPIDLERARQAIELMRRNAAPAPMPAPAPAPTLPLSGAPPELPSLIVTAPASAEILSPLPVEPPPPPRRPHRSKSNGHAAAAEVTVADVSQNKIETEIETLIAPPPPPAPTLAAATPTLADPLSGISTNTFLHRFECSERGNAELLGQMFHTQIRFDYGSKTWLVKDGEFWRPDNDGEMKRKMCKVNDRRKNVAKSVLDTDPDEAKALKIEHLAWAKASNSNRTISQSIELAATLKDLFIPPDQLDQTPFLLGTKEGIFSLETGEKVHPPANVFISKVTAVSPAPSTDCPKWLDFLHKAMCGDQEKIDFLQRFAGYCLTGSIREQALFWFIGDGAAGKGTFLETLLDIQGMGERGYGHSMRMEFLMSHNHSHSTELCDLLGKRLVLCSETEYGKFLKEAELKRLSGGDAITARRVHKDSITFKPTHKLAFMGNHPPQLASVGEAERRRYLMIYWPARFKDKSDPSFDPTTDFERDRGFVENLRSEYAAILRWQINGAILWRKCGLVPPQSIIDYSCKFIGEQDLKGMWLDDCVDLKPDNLALSNDTYLSWSAWCKRHGEEPGTHRSFSNDLLTRGFKIVERGKYNQRYFIGFSLKEIDLASLAEVTQEVIQ